MKRVVVAISLMFLLLGMTVMDAVATDVVILMCQESTLIVPVTKVGIVACSKSSGVSRACPTNPDTACAQVLANYLSDGLVIKNVQLWHDDGLIYTLIRN
ncbi:MAG TPA: hypothetical protein VJZ24_03930 [Thermodesulfovibrionales bacterium]|jgi:hypothetical protein|nr:hypothetical protein [Thermodesulfovibrionales bacterium]